MMNRFLSGVLLSFAALLIHAEAPAQQYPSRPIKLIVPYPPGGNTDIVARLFGQKLSDRIGQPVVFDNRGGAAGALGVGMAANAPADGYTLVIGDLGSLVIAPIAQSNTNYNPQRDLASVGLIASVSIVVSANEKSPDKGFADFLARAKAQPGKLSYGTSGVGAPGHLAMELLRSMTGADIFHVPYKGGAQAVTGLLGGEVDIVVDGAAMAQVKAGRLKALAVTGPRLPALPEVAGVGETVKGFSFTNWWGILTAKGTPDEVVRRLNAELTAIAGLPEVRERLVGLGLAAASGTPQQFADQVRSESDKIQGIVKAAGIKFQ